MKIILNTLFVCSIFISCGPSAQEKAAMQQKHDDSLKIATENSIMQKIKDREDSIATENSIKLAQKHHDDSIAQSITSQYEKKEKIQDNKVTLSKMSNEYALLQKMLVESNSKLTVLYDRKRSDAEFHIGRPKSQREQWLANDQKNIDNMNIQIENIKSKMIQLKRTAQQYR